MPSTSPMETETDVAMFAPFLQAIKKLKLDGVVAIELEYPPNPKRTVAWVKEAYREAAKLMGQAGPSR
jgi:hypothetical protein